MIARPGRPQAAFTAGEIDALLHERSELKYFGTGARQAVNVVIHPQGGFSWRGAFRDIGGVDADAARLFPFSASDGSVYDIVFRPGEASAWGASAALDTVAIAGLTAAMLPEMTAAQSRDTMLVFHEDMKTPRIKHFGPTDWQVDDAPFADVPTWDYGGPIGGGDYTNGVSAVWQLEFVGLTSLTSVFYLKVSNQDTVSIEYNSDMLVLAADIATAMADLPNLAAGFTVVSASGGSSGKKINITFSGDGNEGDGWAVTGVVINKADAAILAFKTTPGVLPGEPVFSDDRGHPHCGCFYSQRLILGGFRSLPNAWMFSKVGDYYNFDDRFIGANGPALIPMDIPGGERIERILSMRNLLIFTTKAEYWLAERGLSKTEAPNHVQSSTHGTRAGVPIVENEGSALFVHPSGGVLGEFRYTDVEGNFTARDISLLAAHLMEDARDMAVRRANASHDGNKVAVVRGDGVMLLSTVLREQDVTAFTRVDTDGNFRAVSVNGDNVLSAIAERGGARRLERLDDGLLLDEATTFAFDPPETAITGLSRFNGREIWVIADGHVLGPFTVDDGTVPLPFAVSGGYVGTWRPPVVETLPLPRTVGPNIVVKRPARIHTLKISVEDTTSLAVTANGGKIRDVPLVKYGDEADTPELQRGFTGTLTVPGLTGFAEDCTATITQLRPGRLTVRSVTIEAAL